MYKRQGQYIEKSAQIIKNKSQNKKPIIIGFSIGAMVAIKVQKALNNIANLYLISPAMPLNDYKIAKQMAGFVAVSYTHLDVYKRQPLKYDDRRAPINALHQPPL